MRDMVIVDRGRNPEEQSVILIENKKLVGFGYINLSHQITHPQALKNIIYTMKDTREARHIIKSHLRKHKTIKVIPLKFCLNEQNTYHTFRAHCKW